MNNTITEFIKNHMPMEISFALIFLLFLIYSLSTIINKVVKDKVTTWMDIKLTKVLVTLSKMKRSHLGDNLVMKTLERNHKINMLLSNMKNEFECDRVSVLEFHNGTYTISNTSILKLNTTHSYGVSVNTDGFHSDNPPIASNGGSDVFLPWIYADIKTNEIFDNYLETLNPNLTENLFPKGVSSPTFCQNKTCKNGENNTNTNKYVLMFEVDKMESSHVKYWLSEQQIKYRVQKVITSKMGDVIGLLCLDYIKESEIDFTEKDYDFCGKFCYYTNEVSRIITE